MADDTITMYDAEGREVKIPRAQWAEEILPGGIERAWDNPDALYAVLIAALNEKLGPQVMEAIRHLAEIDSNPERPAALEGTALIQDKKLDEAERLFQSYIDKHGATASILTNVARIYWERGQRAQAEATLRRALTLDANIDGLLNWHLSIQHQRGGEAAALAAIDQLAENPRNWRVRLIVAARLLKQEKTSEAMALYQEILAQGELPPDALLQMTSDLGSAGRLVEMAEVVLPRYSLQSHGPYAGINLLQALIALRRNEQASTLMGELEALKHPALTSMLAQMSARLAKAPVSRPAAPAEEAKEAELAAVPLLNPVWTAALKKPEWILPRLRADIVKIAIFSLADMTQSAAKQPAGGNPLTRALPLYWSESLRIRSAAATLCVVPVIRKVGPVAVGAPWPLPHMLAACPAEFQPDYVVCGAIKTGSRGAKIELHVFRVHDKQPIKTLRVPVAEDFTGAADAGERELLACLASAGVVASDNPALPPAQALDAYVACLGNLLIETMAVSGLIEAGRMPDERGMLEAVFNLAKAEAKSPLPTILAAASVAAVTLRGAATVAAYKQPMLDLLEKQGQTHDVIRRLAPALHKLLGEQDAFAAEIAGLRESATPDYASWLDSL